MKGKWLILCEFAEILKCLYVRFLPCGGPGKWPFIAHLTPHPVGEPFLASEGRDAALFIAQRCPRCFESVQEAACGIHSPASC